MPDDTFLGHPVQTFPAGTRTAQDAAAAVGCAVGQIVKSLIFRTASGDPLLVIASGSNRVDERKVEALIGERIGKADADFVRSATGFAIGGVPPAGHATAIRALLDEDLLAYETVWAAAGTPRDVIALTPAELARLSNGELADVAQR